jgi:uncharacterized repeat protein (TIGR01451 family)
MKRGFELSGIDRQIDYLPHADSPRKRRGADGHKGGGRGRFFAPLLLALVVGLMLPLVATASHVDPSDLPLTQEEYEELYEATCGSNPTKNIETPPRPPDSKLASDKNNLYTGEDFDGAADTTNIAIWANADDDPKELTLDVSGQRNVINGDAVSRSHLRITASDTIFAHATEYGFRSAGKEAFDMSGEDNCFNLEPDQVNRNAPTPDPDSPDGFPFEEQFDPDGDGNILEHFLLGSPDAFPEIATYNAAGKYYRCLSSGVTGGPINTIPSPLVCDTSSGKLSGGVQGTAMDEGLYVVSGEVSIAPSDLTAKVTVVSGRQLDVSGSVDSDFFPFHKNLLFASQWNEAEDTAETDKAEDALKTGGSESKFTGITVATNGRNIASGSRNSWTCPIMGDRVTLNGSLLYVSGDECGAPGLTISKIPDGVDTGGLSGTVNLGTAIKFKITVTNNGTEDATNVKIDDTLPGTGWTEDPDVAQCTISGGNVLHCDVGTLADGASFSVTVQRPSVAGDCAGDTGTGVRVDNGSLTQDPIDDATATADDGLKATDPGHVFVKCPDAGVLKGPDNTPVIVGNNIVFTINITTNGPGPSPNVVLTDTLPAGFQWTVGGDATAALCEPDPPGPIAGGTTLTCNFGTIPFPGSKTVTLTAPTTGANCGRTVPNTATITGDGDRVTMNNTDNASVTIQCAALRIDKKSTKANNPFVSGGTDPTPAVTTDNATFVITPNPKNGGTLTVVDNGDNDADPAYGRVCVSDVIPRAAGYSIQETVAPKGYGLPTPATQQSAAVTAPGSCSSGATLVTFLDPPLGEIVVRWNDLGSGETDAKIDCAQGQTALAPTPADGTPGAHDDTTETYTNLPAANPPIVYTCTISADP